MKYVLSHICEKKKKSCSTTGETRTVHAWIFMKLYLIVSLKLYFLQFITHLLPNLA